MAVINEEDIANYLLRDLGNREQELVRDLIAEAQGGLEGMLGDSPVEVRSFEETIRRGNVYGPLFLNWTPVVSVSSVTVDGTALSTSAYVVRPFGLDFLRIVNIEDDPEIVVAYDAGVDLAAEDEGLHNRVRAALKRAVAKQLNQIKDDVVGAKKTSVEGHSVEFNENLLTEGDWLTLRRMKRPPRMSF